MNRSKLHLFAPYVIAFIALSVATVLYCTRSKVAFVNSGKLLEKYKGMQEARALTDQKIGVWQIQLDTMVARFETKVMNYKNQFNTLNEKQRLSKEQQLSEQEQELNLYKQRLEKMIFNEEEKNTSGVLKQVNSYIEQYAKDNHYDLVLGLTNSGNILYGSESVDITEDIINGLNKEYRK